MALTNELGLRDLWLFDFSDSPPLRLTESGNNVDPIWTSDSTRIVYARVDSHHFAKADLYSIRVNDLTQKPILLLQHANRVYPTSCSPTSDALLFVEYHPKSQTNIWTLSLKKGEQPEPLLITDSAETQPAFAPNGRWFAYVSDRQGTQEVFVNSYHHPGTPRRISLRGGKEPRWSHDGRELFYLEGDKMMSVTVATEPEFRASAATVLFSGCLDVSWWPAYDVARDGHFVMIRRSASVPALILVLDWFNELKRLVPTRK